MKVFVIKLYITLTCKIYLCSNSKQVQRLEGFPDEAINRCENIADQFLQQSERQHEIPLQMRTSLGSGGQEQNLAGESSDDTENRRQTPACKILRFTSGG